MDQQFKSHIVGLLEEAEYAADPATNGLLDRDEFPILVGKLLRAMRHLLAERDSAEIRDEFPHVESADTCKPRACASTSVASAFVADIQWPDAGKMTPGRPAGDQLEPKATVARNVLLSFGIHSASPLNWA